jgi:hypothetical protein
MRTEHFYFGQFCVFLVLKYQLKRAQTDSLVAGLGTFFFSCTQIGFLTLKNLNLTQPILLSVALIFSSKISTYLG